MMAGIAMTWIATAEDPQIPRSPRRSLLIPILPRSVMGAQRHHPEFLESMRAVSDDGPRLRQSLTVLSSVVRKPCL